MYNTNIKNGCIVRVTNDIFKKKNNNIQSIDVLIKDAKHSSITKTTYLTWIYYENIYNA